MEEAKSEFKVRAGTSYINKRTQAHNQGEIVFFRVDVYELFGVTIETPGIKKCLNIAYLECQKYCPVKTGLMKRSFTMKVLSDHQVELFFDPNKIIGQTRLGKVVETYYPMFVAETAKNYSFLTRMIYSFHETLFDEVKKMINKNKKPTPPKEEQVILQQEFKNYFVGEYLDNKLKQGLVFLQKVRNDYKSRKEENDRIIKEREEHRRRQREQYLALKKQLKEGRK